MVTDLKRQICGMIESENDGYVEFINTVMVLMNVKVEVLKFTNYRNIYSFNKC